MLLPKHSTITWTEFCHFLTPSPLILSTQLLNGPLSHYQIVRSSYGTESHLIIRFSFFLSILALVSEELPDVPCKLNHMKIMIKPCDENISARLNYLFSLLPTRTHLCTCKNPDGKGYDIPVGNNERGLQSELTINFLILLVS